MPGLVTCIIQQTCKLDVETLTNSIAKGHHVIKNISTAQIKFHLLSTCWDLSMLHLAFLHQATLQETPLCPTPYLYHHGYLVTELLAAASGGSRYDR